jgi:hypothetical protein
VQRQALSCRLAIQSGTGGCRAVEQGGRCSGRGRRGGCPALSLLPDAQGPAPAPAPQAPPARTWWR